MSNEGLPFLRHFELRIGGQRKGNENSLGLKFFLSFKEFTFASQQQKEKKQKRSLSRRRETASRRQPQSMKIWKRKIVWSTRASNPSMFHAPEARRTSDDRAYTPTASGDKRVGNQPTPVKAIRCQPKRKLCFGFLPIPLVAGPFFQTNDISPPRHDSFFVGSIHTRARRRSHVSNRRFSLRYATEMRGRTASFSFSFSFLFFSPFFLLRQFLHFVQSFDLSAFSIYVDNICNKRGNSMRFLFIFRNFLSASIYFIPYFIVRNFNAISSYTAHYSSKLFFKKQRRYWQTYKIAPYPRTCRRSTLYEGDSFSRSRWTRDIYTSLLSYIACIYIYIYARTSAAFTHIWEQ